MALSESEELELLQLQKAKALTTQNPNKQMGGSPPLGFVAKQVFNMTPMAHPIQNLPLLGALAGSTIANPGLGAAAGAGLGQIAKNMGQIATGDQSAPTTPGSAALSAMGQAAGAGIAQEPQVLKAIPGVPQVADMASKLASRVGNGLARVGEAASGVKVQDIKQLFKNPGMLFTPGDKDAAGQAIGAAKLAAGVNPGVTAEPISFSPDNIRKALDLESTGKKAIEQVSKDTLSGVKPSVEDIGDGLKYISKQIKAGINKGEDVSELINIQNHLNSTLEKVAPEVQAARQQFAPLAQRDKFLKLFPTNKNGTISKANLFYLNTLAKGATAPFRAPLTTGLATSALGGATQGLNAISQIPEARQVLSQVLQQILARQKQAKP